MEANKVGVINVVYDDNRANKCLFVHAYVLRVHVLHEHTHVVTSIISYISIDTRAYI